MRNSTDEVTLAAPAANPDSIALGPAEMAIDPTDPRSPTVNGRPLYLDSGTADLVGNLVARVATHCRAEPSDLYAATRMVRRPDLADERTCVPSHRRIRCRRSFCRQALAHRPSRPGAGFARQRPPDQPVVTEWIGEPPLAQPI